MAEQAGALAVHTLPGAVEAVLPLDPSRMLDGSFVLREFGRP